MKMAKYIPNQTDARARARTSGTGRGRVHRQRLQAFSASQDCLYVDIANEIAVVEDDFRDWFHLRREETAARYTARLAGHMAALNASEAP